MPHRACIFKNCVMCKIDSTINRCDLRPIVRTIVAPNDLESQVNNNIMAEMAVV